MLTKRQKKNFFLLKKIPIPYKNECRQQTFTTY